MIYGIRPLMEAISSGQEVEKCLFRNGLQGPLFRELFDLVKKHQVPFQFVPEEKLNHLTRKNHQGVLAYISEIEYDRIEQLVPMIFERGEVPFILVLDHVTDVRNFGAIARTAECAGVHAILVPDRGSARIGPDAVKTSAGALHRVAVCRSPGLPQSLQFLADSGLSLVAATEKAELVYHQADYTLPLAVIMGSEDRGIHPRLLELCRTQVRIPILGQIGSLNVSVAAGVICYEVVRQREGVKA